MRQDVPDEAVQEAVYFPPWGTLAKEANLP